jgi:hypothetical protein
MSLRRVGFGAQDFEIMTISELYLRYAIEIEHWERANERRS